MKAMFMTNDVDGCDAINICHIVNNRNGDTRNSIGRSITLY